MAICKEVPVCLSLQRQAFSKQTALTNYSIKTKMNTQIKKVKFKSYFKIVEMKYFLFVFFQLTASISSAQAVKNTSYTTQIGEKVLRLEAILPITQKEAWQLFATDEGLKKWVAPVAHIELKTGGYILTNYDTTKSLSDSSSIKLPIINYIEQELLTLKVNLNNNFSKNVQNEDENLQEIIQLISVGPKTTKLISSMIGWGRGDDWTKTYNFFVAGNIYTYEELLKLFK